MLWEMVSGAAAVEEDEGRMKAAAAWPPCERREGTVETGKNKGISRSLMSAGGRSLQLTLDPGRSPRLGRRSRIWIQGFCTGVSQGGGAAECPALNLILASPLL